MSTGFQLVNFKRPRFFGDDTTALAVDSDRYKERALIKATEFHTPLCGRLQVLLLGSSNEDSHTRSDPRFVGRTYLPPSCSHGGLVLRIMDFFF